MKQRKIVEAYKATDRIKDLDDIPNDIAYTFYKIRKVLQPQWDYQIERENALQKKYKFTFNGKIMKFNSEEDRNACDKEFRELSEMEIDLTFTKIPFNVTDRPLLSVSEMEALEDFLDYQ